MEETLIASMKEAIAVASEPKCAYLMLKDDPFFNCLPSGAEQEAIQLALAAGQAAAQQVINQYGQVPGSIASSLQV